MMVIVLRGNVQDFEAMSESSPSLSKFCGGANQYLLQLVHCQWGFHPDSLPPKLIMYSFKLWKTFIQIVEKCHNMACTLHLPLKMPGFLVQCLFIISTQRVFENDNDLALYCREPPPKGLRGYGGGRTIKWRAQ